MTFELFDMKRREWRGFSIVPPDPSFEPRCGGMHGELHQFAAGAQRCACGQVTR